MLHDLPYIIQQSEDACHRPTCVPNFSLYSVKRSYDHNNYPRGLGWAGLAPSLNCHGVITCITKRMGHARSLGELCGFFGVSGTGKGCNISTKNMAELKAWAKIPPGVLA